MKIAHLIVWGTCAAITACGSSGGSSGSEPVASLTADLRHHHHDAGTDASSRDAGAADAPQDAAPTADAAASDSGGGTTGTGSDGGATGSTGSDAGSTGSGGTGLTLSGNQFLLNGQPYRLLGVDRSGTEYACIQGWGIFDGPNDAASVQAMQAWHVNTVRVPLNEDCWLGINGVNPSYGGSNYVNAIVAYVQLLHQYGMTVVLDLHWTAPGTTQATGQQPMPDMDHSPAFWKSVATTFRNDPLVVFDLFNEPYGVGWSCWKSGGCSVNGYQVAGMQTLIDAVRGVGATQPLMVAGLGWANDLTGWLANRPTDTGSALAASFHVYNFSGCADTTCWDNDVAPVAQQVPVVTGEQGENDCGHSFVDGYDAWSDSHGVSYLGWTWDTWDCASGPALISDYSGTPTAFGIGLQQHLLQVNP